MYVQISKSSIYIYIYIYRERERERERCMYAIPSRLGPPGRQPLFAGGRRVVP